MGDGKFGGFTICFFRGMPARQTEIFSCELPPPWQVYPYVPISCLPSGFYGSYRGYQPNPTTPSELHSYFGNFPFFWCLYLQSKDCGVGSNSRDVPFGPIFRIPQSHAPNLCSYGGNCLRR